MAYTITSTFGADVAGDLAPWLTDHLAWLVDAIGGMFDPVYELVRETGNDGDVDYVPSYGALFDPGACPANGLGYLGQFVGVQIPAGADPATARALVRNKAGFQRGTPAAITGAAQQWLTGTQSASLYERTAADGSMDAYHFLLVVRPEEVADAASLTAAVDAVKPGGVMWTLVQSDVWVISAMEADYASISALEAAFSRVKNLELDVT